MTEPRKRTPGAFDEGLLSREAIKFSGFPVLPSLIPHMIDVGRKDIKTVELSSTELNIMLTALHILSHMAARNDLIVTAVALTALEQDLRFTYCPNKQPNKESLS